MKKLSVMMLILIVVLSVCAFFSNRVYKANSALSDVFTIQLKTDDIQNKVMSVCNSAVIDVNYYDVAKDTGKNSNSSENNYFVEYSGSVRIGIDSSKVSVSIDKENRNIIIEMPHAGIIRYSDIYDSNEFNKSDKLTSDFENSAKKINLMYSACSKLESDIQLSGNYTSIAEKNVICITEDYINKVCSINGESYTIEFIFIEQ